jgi:hypothetical protein
VDITNKNRAIRYRRLAKVEPDECKAAFLRKLAEEAERGLLCTVDQLPVVRLPAGSLSNSRIDKAALDDPESRRSSPHRP